MGKYDYKKSKFDGKDLEIGAINELAERNRLKRLEIRLMQGLLTSKRELEKELEDRA